MFGMDIRRVLTALWSKSAAVVGLGFLALFVQAAQAQPLNYFKNYFVTGDYVVGGVGLANVKPVASGSPATYSVADSINFSGVPCTSGPGLFASVVPCTAPGAQPADVIAAFLYWQTIENTAPCTPVQCGSSANGSFDGSANTFTGVELGNPTVAACTAGGGTQGNAYARVYRADVLRFLPVNNTANVRVANGTQTFTLSSTSAATQFVGATLVVVYRVVTPGNPNITPLRSVVIYDGSYTGTPSSGLNQTIGGFYQASSDADAKMTQIVGNGQPVAKGSKETQTLLVNGSIPQGVSSDPFVGAQGANWDNYTFNYNLAPNASSVDASVSLKLDCLTWAAIITSTNVQDTDHDGLLDVWEQSGLNFNPGVRYDGVVPAASPAPAPATFGTCVGNASICLNLPKMGANWLVPDIFMQVDWMYDLNGASNPPHSHNPQFAALKMVGDVFKAHGINLHFDVGSDNPQSPYCQVANTTTIGPCNYQSNNSPYIIPAAYARGGNAINEGGTLLCPNAITMAQNPAPACAFPSQSDQYSVLGWKFGFGAVRDGDPVLGLPQLFPQNEKDTVHYALFGHALAATTPLSTPNAGSISGVADHPGGDILVTLGLWRSDIPAVDQVGTLLDQAGTLMHELGHNLGLSHGGWRDTPTCMPDYPSVMNYLYQVAGLTDAQGNEHLDYSYGLLLPLLENDLSVKIPMGLQTYRVRYFGPFNTNSQSPLANTLGQSSKAYCSGGYPTESGQPYEYVRLEWPSVSTPDWSNGTVPLGTKLPPLDINYDGTAGNPPASPAETYTNETFTDSPDWLSINLQQVSARPAADGFSLNLGLSQIGLSQIGLSQIGLSQIGISDAGTAALGQDALGDQDFASFLLSGGATPPTGLGASISTAPPPSPIVNNNPGGTGNQLTWIPYTGAQAQSYNIYRCNATAGPCTPTAPKFASVSGGSPTPVFTDFVNDFVDAGASTNCNTGTCYNTTYTYYVTEVVMVGNVSSETGPSSTVNSEVNHLFVMGNISPQTVVYGAANPTITTNIYGNGSLTASQVSCVYSPATPRNASTTPYPIVCSGPTTVSTTDGVTYNAKYLTNVPSTLTITPRPITVTAAASSKVYNSTMSSSAIPTITTGSLAYSDTVTWTETYDNKNVGTVHVMTPVGTVNDGNGGNNYTVTFVTINTGVITPAPLTITASTNTKVYDSTTTAAAAPTTSGLQGSDTVTGLVETYATKNVGTGLTLTVSPGYTVNDGNSGNNYTVTTATISTGVITKAPLTITATANTKTYDSTTIAAALPTVSGLQGNSDSVTGLAETYISKNAGTGLTLTVSPGYTVNDGNSGGNYSVATAPNNAGVINKAPLAITAVTNTKTYDGTTSAAALPTVFGLVGNSDTVTGLGEAYASKNAGPETLSVTTYNINDGNNGGNYSLTLNTAAGTINKAPLTITAVTNSKTYDGTPSAAATPTVAGLQTGDSATAAEAYTTSNAGTGLTLMVSTYTVTDGNNGGNYTVSLVSNTTGVIIQATPMVTDGGPTPSTPDYGQPVTLTVTIAPPQSGEVPTGTVTFSFTLNSITNYICANGTIATTTPACTVPLTLSNGNYVATVTTSTLPTAAENVMATYSGDTNFQGETANNVSVTVSQANSAITLTKPTDPSTYGNAVNLTVEVTDATGGSIGVPTGTVTLSFKVNPSDPNGQVYYICADGSVITTVCMNPVTLAPDPNNPIGATATVSTTNLPAGLASATPAFSYPINATYSGDTNFTASGPFGLSQTVNQRPITVTAATDSKNYDGTTSSVGVPTITTGSLANTDTATFTQAFDTRNAGTGKTLTPAGSVNDNFSGNNYVITFTPMSTGVIKPLAITVTAAANTKTYDATTASSATPAIAPPLISPDSSGFIETFDTKNVGAGKTLTPSGSANDGNSGNNYAVTFVANTAGVVNKEPLTITAITNTKNYDGTTSAAAIPTVTGLKGSDTVTGLSETYDTPAPGTGKTLSVATYTINDGSSGANYAVTTVTNTTGVIISTLSLLPANLATGDQGVLYQPQQLVASGGTPPYGNWNWTAVVNSALPPGLSLSPSLGTITGTPTAAGTYTFIVSVTDSLGAMASQTYSITVNLPPSISGATLPAATVGTPYTSAAIPVSNGTAPFNWSATGLPAGLSISGGVISGTATGGSFASPYDAPSWTPSATNGGTTTITPNCLANVNVTDSVGGVGSANFLIGSTPSSPCASFGYNLTLSGGGVPESTWSFTDTAATTGTLTFNWQYTGFHAFFNVTALLQVFSGGNTVTLYSAGPADCCSSPSGGFNVQGTGTIAVTGGQPFGFTVGGSNFDSNATLQGTLYITNFAISPQP